MDRDETEAEKPDVRPTPRPQGPIYQLAALMIGARLAVAGA
jgi:hypothetical protein